MNCIIDIFSEHDILIATILIILSCCIYGVTLFNKTFIPQTKLYLSSCALFFVGLTFFVMAVILKGHPIRSSLYLALGSIFLFSIAYTAYSEYRLSSLILNEIEKLIVEKLSISTSVIDYGMSEIEHYDQQTLLTMIKSCHSCKYIVLYSLDFLRKNYLELEQFVTNNKLFIVMTDPSHNNTILALEDSFEERAKDEIKNHIAQSKDYICHNICKDGLHKDNIQVAYVNRVLTYSSYIFDDRVFWLCPRQSTKTKKEGVVFIFKKNLENNFYYCDSLEVIKNADILCNRCSHHAPA